MLKASELKKVEKRHSKKVEAEREKRAVANDRERALEEERARTTGLSSALKAIEKKIKKCIRREEEYTYHNKNSIEYTVGENHYGEYLGDLICKKLDKLGYSVLWKPQFCEADWSDPDAPGHDSCWVYTIVVYWK